MSKGLRLSEKWFRRGLWLIALVFAGFLIGLGGLVVDDLPQVETQLTMEGFIDKQAADRIHRSMGEARQAQVDKQAQLEQAQLKLRAAQSESQAARETFSNWLATRSATQQSDQNPELISRTRALDAFKARERSAQTSVEALEQEQLTSHSCWPENNRRSPLLRMRRWIN